MKKIVSLIVCLVLVFACGTVAFAETNSEKLYADILAVVPDNFEEALAPQIEKIIMQLDIADDEYTALKAILDETDEKIDFTQGTSIDQYPAADAAVLQANFDEACAVLGLTYEVVEKNDPVHDGDILVYVYGENGKLLGTVDGDVEVGKTGSPIASEAWVYLAVAVAVIAAGASLFVMKSKKAEAK